MWVILVLIAAVFLAALFKELLVLGELPVASRARNKADRMAYEFRRGFAEGHREAGRHRSRANRRKEA